MSILSKMFGGGGQSPADAARQYTSQIPGVGKEYYDPFIAKGREAGDILSGEYGNLISDPNAFIDRLMGGYKPSEGYQYQKEQLGKELSANAAAGGVAGTPYARQQQGEMIQGLLSKDMQDYLSNVLGAYKTGLGGESDIFGKGFTASGNLADMLGGTLNQEAGLAYKEAADRKARGSDFLSMLGKALSTGAGYALGGPMGGAGSLLFGGGLSSDMYGGG